MQIISHTLRDPDIVSVEGGHILNERYQLI